jgi:hypothetical protein
MLWIRIRLVDSAQLISIVNDTWRAGEHEVSDASLSACVDDIARSFHVGTEEVVITTPHIDFSGGMENTIYPFEELPPRGFVTSEVDLSGGYPQFSELWIATPR